MNKLFFLVIAVMLFGGMQAQELNCQVNIVVDNKVEVSSTEQEMINQMKQNAILLGLAQTIIQVLQNQPMAPEAK